MLSLIKRESRIPSVFDDVFGNNGSLFSDVFGQSVFNAPSMDIDIVDQADKIIVKGDLPGLNKDDIKVTMDRGVLTISGERKQEVKEEQDGVLRQEVRYGSFSRSFALNYDVANQDIKASYKDGVLRVELPKKEQKSLTKSIKIE